MYEDLIRGTDIWDHFEDYSAQEERYGPKLGNVGWFYVTLVLFIRGAMRV